MFYFCATIHCVLSHDRTCECDRLRRIQRYSPRPVTFTALHDIYPTVTGLQDFFLRRKEALLTKFSSTVTRAGDFNPFLCHGPLSDSSKIYGVPLRKIYCNYPLHVLGEKCYFTQPNSYFLFLRYNNF